MLIKETLNPLLSVDALSLNVSSNYDNCSLVTKLSVTMRGCGSSNLRHCHCPYNNTVHLSPSHSPVTKGSCKFQSSLLYFLFSSLSNIIFWSCSKQLFPIRTIGFLYFYFQCTKYVVVKDWMISLKLSEIRYVTFCINLGNITYSHLSIHQQNS